MISYHQLDDEWCSLPFHRNAQLNLALGVAKSALTYTLGPSKAIYMPGTYTCFHSTYSDLSNATYTSMGWEIFAYSHFPLGVMVAITITIHGSWQLPGFRCPSGHVFERQWRLDHKLRLFFSVQAQTRLPKTGRGFISTELVWAVARVFFGDFCCKSLPNLIERFLY